MGSQGLPIIHQAKRRSYRSVQEGYLGICENGATDSDGRPARVSITDPIETTAQGLWQRNAWWCHLRLLQPESRDPRMHEK